MSLKNPIVLDMRKPRPLSRHIKNVIFRRHRNFNILIVGPTQTGKSTVAIFLGPLLYPLFSLENDCAIIGAKDFQEKLMHNVKRGCVKLLDEIGVAANHHKWFQSIQQATAEIMTTHGYEGKIIIATSPVKGTINKDIRNLFDLIIKTNDKSMHWDEKKVYTMMYKQEVDPLTGKEYRSYPIGKFPDGSRRQIKTYKFPFPKKELWDRYRELSDSRKKDLQMKNMEQTRQEEGKEEAKTFVPEVYAKMIIDNPEKYVTTWHRRNILDVNRMMNEFPGLGEGRIRRIKAAVGNRLDEWLSNRPLMNNQ